MSTTRQQEADRNLELEQETSSDPRALERKITELETKNERLRNAVATAHRQRYRRSALVMGVLGLVSLLGAGVFQNMQAVLIALGGTGLYAAVLIYFLTPERFVAATIGGRVYGAIAENESAIVDDLDLQGQPHVVPGTGTAAPARLFVPLDSATSVPDSLGMGAPFRIEDERGLVFKPTGVPLYELLVDANDSLPDAPESLARIVGEAVVEQFELVDKVDVDTEPGRATLAVKDSAFGPLDQFDHPVVSLLATTLAIEQKMPVKFEVAEAEAQEGWLVTYRWDIEGGSPEASSEETA